MGSTEKSAAGTKSPTASWRLVCGRVLCLIAAFFATGLAWDLLQFAAWGGMYVQNLRERDAAAAFAHTFSEEGRCPVCKTVEKARQGDEQTPALQGWGLRAWLLPLQNGQLSLVHPPLARRMPPAIACARAVSRSDRPSLPPPK
ncbi:MAG: hypothetical protein JJT96_19000 [Opitutales bacterium]|nr:hypothetical protein [Opitutales bacterium]